MKKKLLSVSLMWIAAAALAEPTIVVDRVQQRFPWNGVVDIDYTIAGIAGDPLDYAVEFTVNGAPISNFVDYAACDLPSANGANRVAWQPAADGLACAVAGASVAAKIVKRVLTATDATYLIADLSAGSAAASYPVRYAADCDSSQFNKDIYKTDRLVLKRIVTNEFWMGVGGYDDKGKKGATWNGDVTNPGSRCRVKLTHDYYLGIFEMTQGQYLKVMGSNPSTFKGTKGGDDLRRPVESITYATAEDVGGVLARLSARVQARGVAIGEFRFPTEAQWECACRAGTTTMFYFGDYATAYGRRHDYARIGPSKDTYCTVSGNTVTTNDMSSVVGTRLPNQWGFYDMFGNVAEFCSDWYAPIPTDDSQVENPEQTETTDYKRCLRGCGFRVSSDYYTMFAGARGTGGGNDNSSGFRVAVTLK